MLSYKLLEGNCLELMPTLEDKSVDMILCDLPYGSTACAWDTIIPFTLLWEQYERIIKDNSAIVLTGTQPFTSTLITSNLKLFKYEWIWHKNTGSNFAQLKMMPFKQHENILIFGKGRLKYNPQMELKTQSSISRSKYKPSESSMKGDTETNKHRRGYDEKRLKSDYRYPSTVQKFNRETGLHPTQKPVTLFEYLIKTYTDEGDIVLDNCAGSGTTGEACYNTKRKAILIELDPEYIQIIKDRMKEISTQQKLF